METEENKKLSAEQSLKIISEAIEQSRKDMTRSCGKTLLMWGVIICLTATVIGILWKLTGSWYWNFMWLVMVFRRPACQQEDNQKREHSRNSQNVYQ